MSMFYKLFFSHEWLLRDIFLKRFRAIYWIPILFFIGCLVALSQPLRNPTITSDGVYYAYLVALLFLFYFLYPLFYVRKYGIFILIGTLVSFTISLLRFFLFTIGLLIIEFPIHSILIKIRVSSINNLKASANILLFIGFLYFIYLLLSFLYLHRKNMKEIPPNLNKN